MATKSTQPKKKATKRVVRSVTTDGKDAPHAPSERSEQTRGAVEKAVLDHEPDTTPWMQDIFGNPLPAGAKVKEFQVRRVERDPLFAGIRGTTLDGKEFTQLVRFVDELPGQLHAELIIATEQPLGVLVEHLIGLVRSAVHPDYEEVYDELMRSKDRLVDLPALADLAAWLVEEYTGRPTEPSID